MKRLKLCLERATASLCALVLACSMIVIPVQDVEARSGIKYARSAMDCGPGERFVRWGHGTRLRNWGPVLFRGVTGECVPDWGHSSWSTCRSSVIGAYYVGATALTVVGTGGAVGGVLMAARAGAAVRAGVMTAQAARGAQNLSVNIQVGGATMLGAAGATHFSLSIPADISRSSSVGDWVARQVCLGAQDFWRGL